MIKPAAPQNEDLLVRYNAAAHTSANEIKKLQKTFMLLKINPNETLGDLKFQNTKHKIRQTEQSLKQ